MESSKEKIMIELEKTQKCLEWIKTMLFLDTNAEKATKRIVKRGQVYDCLLGIGVGSEESKKRPCVILQYDSANAKSPKDRKSTRLNSSHANISYAVFCLKKKKTYNQSKINKVSH